MPQSRTVENKEFRFFNQEVFVPEQRPSFKVTANYSQIKTQTPIQSQKLLRFLTSFVVILGAGYFSFTELSKTQETETTVTRDLVFERTSALNAYFLENMFARNALLILCSGLMDLSMLAGLY